VQSFAVNLLNGVSYGLLLFMLSAGLTLIFSMLGVLNFAHASFYMLGAYVGYSVAARAGFWSALVIAPLVVGLLGAALERWLLRRVRTHGHLAELLLTFGAAYLLGERACAWFASARRACATKSASSAKATPSLPRKATSCMCTWIARRAVR